MRKSLDLHGSCHPASGPGAGLPVDEQERLSPCNGFEPRPHPSLGRSKFACRGFFESTRAELIHEKSNVRLSMVHLPAINTPQFDWCQSIFDVHPQPAPPIYQPEIPAKFILEVALDGRRHKIVGSWNKILVVAASLAPGLGNQYAAIGAWESQLTPQKVGPSRPSNLYEPVDTTSDHGAHGEFDHQARGFFTPSFLRSLPRTAMTLGRAVANTIEDKRRRF